jgi:CTP synthase (UTP-ammonia lyase)
MYNEPIDFDWIRGLDMADSVKIGVIGDYEPDRTSHQATNDALSHCAQSLGIGLEVQWLPTEPMADGVDDAINRYDGLWCAPGSPYRSMAGALNAIRFARENGRPFIGTCGGFQHTVIEYARNKLGIMDAGHAEYSPASSNLFITPLTCSLAGQTRRIFLDKESKAYAFYQKPESVERFSCSFGLNPAFRSLLEDSGFKVAGTDEAGDVRLLELSRNEFYIATLFLPQLSSTKENPHRLILAFLTHAMEFHRSKV